jgi:exonuclease V gamma subunit
MVDNTLRNRQISAGAASDGEKRTFEVYHSNRIEDLAVLTAAMIKDGICSKPLDPVEFVVPNSGIRQWLDLKLAENLGISMRNVYSTPVEFVRNLLSRPEAAAGGKISVLKRDSLIWIIYSQLRGIIDSDDFRSSDVSCGLRQVFKAVSDYVLVSSDRSVLKKINLLNFLSPDNNNSGSPAGGFEWDSYASASGSEPSCEKREISDKRLYQLSDVLAGIFETYTVSRGYWLKNAVSSEIDYSVNFNRYRQIYEEGREHASCGGCVTNDQSDSENVFDRMWRGCSPEEFSGLEILEQKLVLDNMWQVVLWKRIASASGYGKNASAFNEQRHFFISEAAYILIQKLEDCDSQLSKALPENLFIFGFSALDPLYLRFFRSISRYTRILFMYFNPCRLYSCGSSKCIENRLLASWGELHRSTVKRLSDNVSSAEFELFTDPLTEKKGILQFLQSCILDGCEPDPFHSSNVPAKKPFKWEELEHNLEIHASFSRLREVETIYDRILKLFEQDPSLKPNDIAVFAPNINFYAPYIHGVFGREFAEYERCIPYKVVDQHYGEVSTFFSSILDLLNLPETHITGPYVLKLLEVSAIRNRFGFSVDDLSAISQLITDCVRGDSSETELLDPGFEQPAKFKVYSTWSRALRRMMAGSVMDTENSDTCWLDDVSLYDKVQEQHIEILASLKMLILKLDDLRRCLRESGSMTPAEWRKLVNARIIDEFYADDYENYSEIYAVNSIISELSVCAENAGSQISVSRDVFSELLSAASLNFNMHSQVISGRVSFCSLVQMRHIPYRHVFMMGMNSRDFPRQEEIYDFDLIRRDGGNGAGAVDRCRRDDDHSIFLNTLLSARDSVYISYIGRSIVSNAEKNPSIVITELEHFLSENLAMEEIYRRYSDLPGRLQSGNIQEELDFRRNTEKLAEENSKRLVRPGLYDALVITDAMHQWDPSNYECDPSSKKIKRGSLSYQSEWCPPDPRDRISGKSFFKAYVSECMRVRHYGPKVFLSKNDELRNKDGAKIIQYLLYMINRSCFTVRVKDKVFSIRDLTDMENGNRSMLDFVINELSSEVQKCGRLNADEAFPEAVLNYIIKKVASAEKSKESDVCVCLQTYSIDGRFNTLVTDAGIISPDISAHFKSDRRTLSLNISDLCSFANDPLDELFRRHFNVKKDEDDRYKRSMEDTEPLDVNENTEDNSIKEQIVEYCRMFLDRLQSDRTVCSEFWSQQPEQVFDELMSRHPEIFSGLRKELKYKGLIPSGRNVAYIKQSGEKKDFDSSEILGFSTSKYFMMTIRRLHYLHCGRYSMKSESVRVRSEFKLSGTDLPEPYRSVFADKEHPFTVIVEGNIDNIYTGENGQKEYLHFRDILNLEKQKFLFLLNSVLLSLNHSVGISRFIDLENSDSESSKIRLAEFEKNGEEYLRQLIICYLRGMTEPLLLLRYSNKQDDKKINTGEISEKISAVMAERIPMIPLNLVSQDSEYRILFDAGELPAGRDIDSDSIEKIKGYDWFEKNIKNTQFYLDIKNLKEQDSDTFEDNNHNQWLTVRQRMLIEKKEKLPLRKTAATKFVLEEWPNALLTHFGNSENKDKEPVNKKTGMCNQKNTFGKVMNEQELPE